MPFLGLMTKKEHEREMLGLRDEAKRLVADALKASGVKYPSWLLATADAERLNMPDPSVYGNQAETFRKSSWVLQAVNMVASAGSLTPFGVARRVAGKEPKDIPNHEYELLLEHPNPTDSRQEFLYATIAYYKLNGNAYWWLNKANESAVPDEMWVIPPSQIIPVPDGKMYIRGYYYYPGDGKELFLQPWEVVHFRSFNPFSRFLGLSAVESLALTIYGDIGMQEYNAKLYKENNGRVPSVMAFADPVGDTDWDIIQHDAKQASTKREMMMLRGVGKGGVEWLQNALSQSDMQYLESRKFNREEIYNTLAPGTFSMLSESSTEANSKTGFAAFYALSIYPMHVMMAEKITNSILILYLGRPLVGRFEDVRITDQQQRISEMQEYSKTHTVAEVREKYWGDEPLGDERDDLLPAQVNAQTGDGSAPEPQPTQLQNAAQPNTPQNQNDANASQQNDTSLSANEAAMMMARDELAQWERKALRNIGVKFDFVVRHIQNDVAIRIDKALPACKDETAVRLLFNRIGADTYPQSAAALHLEGLKLAVMQMEKSK